MFGFFGARAVLMIARHDFHQSTLVFEALVWFRIGVIDGDFRVQNGQARAAFHPGDLSMGGLIGAEGQQIELAVEGAQRIVAAQKRSPKVNTAAVIALQVVAGKNDFVFRTAATDAEIMGDLVVANIEGEKFGILDEVGWIAINGFAAFATGNTLADEFIFGRYDFTKSIHDRTFEQGKAKHEAAPGQAKEGTAGEKLGEEVGGHEGKDQAWR